MGNEYIQTSASLEISDMLVVLKYFMLLSDYKISMKMKDFEKVCDYIPLGSWPCSQTSILSW